MHRISLNNAQKLIQLDEYRHKKHKNILGLKQMFLILEFLEVKCMISSKTNGWSMMKALFKTKSHLIRARLI